MAQYDRIQWAEEAVRGIVSPKERQSARQELLDHIDDHADALMAAGLPRSRALEQAIAAMGDPEETAKLLRKAHQPILTHLLQITKWVAIVLAVVTVWNTLLFPGWGNQMKQYIPAKPEKHRLEQVVPDYDPVQWGAAVCPDVQAQAGDYTVSFRYVTAAWNADSSSCVVEIFLLFTPRFFWQEDAVPQPLFVLRDAAGHTWSTTQRMAKSLHTVSYPGRRQVHLIADLDFFPENGQLELTYTGSGQQFTLPIDLTGGVVYEK